MLFSRALGLELYFLISTDGFCYGSRGCGMVKKGSSGEKPRWQNGDEVWSSEFFSCFFKHFHIKQQSKGKLFEIM